MQLVDPVVLWEPGLSKEVYISVDVSITARALGYTNRALHGFFV